MATQQRVSPTRLHLQAADLQDVLPGPRGAEEAALPGAAALRRLAARLQLQLGPLPAGRRRRRRLRAGISRQGCRPRVQLQLWPLAAQSSDRVPWRHIQWRDSREQ